MVSQHSKERQRAEIEFAKAQRTPVNFTSKRQQSNVFEENIAGQKVARLARDAAVRQVPVGDLFIGTPL